MALFARTKTARLDDAPSFQKIARVFCWLFASLACLSLLTAPEATHDEIFHATNIWCGQGERDPYCTGIRLDVDNPGALVNIDWVTCQRDVTQPLVCARDGSNLAFRTINHGNLYPELYYWTLSWFVVPSFELSLVLTRMASAFAIVAVLTFLARLLPDRERFVLFLMVLTALPSSGHFLFSSINPSSWTLLGVGFGWLALHASLTLQHELMQRRVALMLLSVLMFGMAIGSRWDAIPMIGFVSVLVIAQRLLARGTRRVRWVVVLAVVLFGLLLVLESNHHLSLLRYLPLLFTYSDGQLNNVTFLSHYLIFAIPNALGALNSVPSLSGIYIPALVGIINIVLLAVLLVASVNWPSRSQLVGVLASVLMVGATIATHVALIDNRDPFGIEPRYLVPMLPFVVGWWFLYGPEKLENRVQGHLNGILVAAVLAFALWTFSIAERVVDRQSFGLRVLPEGLDQWWWSWLPIGPNSVLGLAVLCYGAFLWKFRAVFMTNGSGTE